MQMFCLDTHKIMMKYRVQHHKRGTYSYSLLSGCRRRLLPECVDDRLSFRVGGRISLTTADEGEMVRCVDLPATGTVSGA